MSWSSRLRAAAVALVVGLIVCGASAARARQEGGRDRDDAPAPAAREVPRVSANESFLRWGARASGPIGLVILAMSFYLIALVAWMFFEYRRSVALPEALIRDVTEQVAVKNYTEAYQRLAQDPSFLARVLAAGVRKLPSGLPVAQRAMEMANEDATMAMEHRTTYLATVGTLGPMIGLLGTVYGMILSFRVIATAGSSPQASQLAAGISTALFATLEGIALSVPAIAFYALFRNRIARLSLEVEMEAETLLEQFAAGVRMPHPLATAAAVPSRTALPPKGD
jgi:biopolymer transport protein ExbB